MASFISLLTLAAHPGCSRSETPEPEAVKRVRVFEVGPLSEGQIRRLSGRVQAAERASLSFGVAGRVASISAIVGNDVSEGQLLAELDEEPLRLALESARGELATARAELADAERTFNRMDAAFAANAVSPNEFDAATRAVEAAQGKVAVATAAIDQAEFDFARVRLVAPYAGRVVAAPVERFQEVAVTETVVVLQSSDALEVQTSIPETMIQNVNVGQVVQVGFSQMETDGVQAIVTEIGSEAETGNAFPVTLLLPEVSTDVRPGMTASVTFSFRARDQDQPVYLIPLSTAATHVPVDPSAHDLPEGLSPLPVFVLDQQSRQITLRIVEAGGLRGNDIEVFGGLEPGELVVSAGVQLLRDGMPAERWDPDQGVAP